MLQKLQGKKTYLVAAAALGVTGAYILGFIGVDTANTILTLLGFGGLITLRAGITKTQQ